MRFSEMNLDMNLVRAIKEMGYDEPTSIQEKCIPLLKEGKDIIAQSMTGSGKTAAFGLPILEKIQSHAGLQCLILIPTRELCVQVSRELVKYSKYKKVTICQVYGGVALNPQISKLERSDIVVATPGRLLDHMQRGTINLSQVKFLVLDEADKMFEMGFIDDVRTIVSKVSRQRQTMLFSATISDDIRRLSKDYMQTPVSVKTSTYVDKSMLSQTYYNVEPRDKFSLFVHLVKEEDPKLAMVFCSTRDNTDVVAKNLQQNGIQAMSIHGGHSQNRRQNIMDDFHAGKIHILVATDVAARGLDIKNVSHVFNYDLPKTSQEYVHRVGRTARAGEHGKAISILAPRDHDNFRRIMDDHSITIEPRQLPQFQRVNFQPRQGGFGRDDRRENRDGGYQKYGHRGPRGDSRSSGDSRGPRPSSGGYSRSSGEGQRTGGYSRSSSGSSRTGSSNYGSRGNDPRRKPFHESSGRGSDGEGSQNRHKREDSNDWYFTSRQK